ncbi:MAG: DegT/DnrJ/EryC1/StrS aminotransferase [Fibrobacteres bacterium]|nr:DegT/DnrJ/EryC1/StrS aminotransferase [Fibrobacterota bacterium]
MTCFTLPPSGNAVPVSFLLEAGDEDFAAAFSAHSGYPADRILFTASGASALYVALRGLAALRPNLRAVAVPAWCCPSVPQCVIQAGLEPVLVDLDPATLGYDAASLSEASGQGLLAVILVHFFGLPQPMPAGDWKDTSFLRDCAQDFDHRRDPEDASPCFYSFGRGKALNAGHGGALCLPGPGPLLEACRSALESLPRSRERTLPKALAINLLSQPRLFWALSRMPFLGLGTTVWKAPIAMESMAAGFHPLGAACLEAYLQRRDFYRKLIGKYRALIQACDGDSIRCPTAPQAGLPTRFALLARDPDLCDALYKGANARFGGVTRMYPEILPGLPGAPAGFGAGREFPGASRVAKEILTLPVTAELMGREDAFLECLAEILEKHGALRKRSAPKQAPARDWTPIRPFIRRPSLFPT